MNMFIFREFWNEPSILRLIWNVEVAVNSTLCANAENICLGKNELNGLDYLWSASTHSGCCCCCSCEFPIFTAAISMMDSLMLS